ncbi:MAG: YggT family protein [Blastocatellia bacterium]|nr:YggT family protein [Blastocatellia bacterium]
MDFIVFVFNLLGTIIFWATIGVSGLLFLRVIMTWLGVNPFGRVMYNLTKITEPFVRPLRQQVGGRFMRYDLMPLVLGVLVLFIGLFIASMIWQLTGIFDNIVRNALRGTLTFKFLLANLISLAGLLYVLAIFLRFILPYFGFGYGNRTLRFIYSITEPLLKPLRRIFVMGMFDFSPFIAMIIVQLATGILVGMLN